MLFLIEGLNCAGKSTYIQNCCKNNIGSFGITTPWCNPLRWNGKKNSLLKEDSDIYSIGAYETILRMFKGWPEKVFWDRTFISSYVYDTIYEMQFNYLVDIGLENKLITPNIVYIDTAPKTCLDRLKQLRENDPKYKDYIWCDTLREMERIKFLMEQVISKLSLKGFITKYVKGE